MSVSGLVGMAWSYGLNSVQQSHEKAMWQGMEQQINDLTNKQRTELENLLKETQDEVERSRILFQYLAVQKNEDLINQTKAERNRALIMVGIGIILLAGVIFLARKKNG